MTRRSQQKRRKPDRLPLAEQHLAQRPLGEAPADSLPRVEVRAPTWHPFLYRNRLGAFDAEAHHGDLVRLVETGGEHYGYGLFNPRAEITVRTLSRETDVPNAAWWQRRIAAAIELRRNVLKLDEYTTAGRVVHAEGDGVPGVVVDRYGDVLSAEVFSLAMWQRAEAFVQLLADALGVRHWTIRPGPHTVEQEGFTHEPLDSPGRPERVVIREFGTQFEVDFRHGHKTGFFCDQRDNRRRLAEFTAGRSVLDLCCYTGGFALQAKRLGEAGEATGVDLDEQAVAQAKRNARLNRATVRFVHADVFPFMRDMLRNGRQFGIVVLDPPKLIHDRREVEEGARRYFDLNRLALQLVEPGGLLVTCSCSGLMPAEQFQKTVSAAVPAGRSAQILFRTGAAPDHPLATNCPETEYLKALWLRVLE
ncbi:MAG: class I SAM-dependent rRNA methyltransferase [Planctomycetaceae bacterium]